MYRKQFVIIISATFRKCKIWPIDLILCNFAATGEGAKNALSSVTSRLVLITRDGSRGREITKTRFIELQNVALAIGTERGPRREIFQK